LSLLYYLRHICKSSPPLPTVPLGTVTDGDWNIHYRNCVHYRRTFRRIFVRKSTVRSISSEFPSDIVSTVQ
ncbi:hypothetical protein PIB30_094243, partial [Stylosanthes scabra]|nr:hypothetical protein [Stylosanthes scabra]